MHQMKDIDDILQRIEEIYKQKNSNYDSNYDYKISTSQFYFSRNVITHVNNKLGDDRVHPQFVIYMSDISGERKLTSWHLVIIV